MKKVYNLGACPFRFSGSDLGLLSLPLTHENDARLIWANPGNAGGSSHTNKPRHVVSNNVAF